MLLGLVDVWYRNFHGFASRSVAPYHHGLKRLPAYLQQLEMESNGKRVDRDGARRSPTRPARSSGASRARTRQHAYFQMLHQGTDIDPGRVHPGRASRAHDCDRGAGRPRLAQRSSALMLRQANGLAQTRRR